MADPAGALSEVLLYDGDCGFCESSVRRLTRGGTVPVRALPWQSVDPARLAALRLSAEDLAQAAWFVQADGRLRRGHLAIAMVLRRSGGARAAAGRLISVPPLSAVARLVYALVARNRHRMPGSSGSCAVVPRAD